MSCATASRPDNPSPQTSSSATRNRRSFGRRATRGGERGRLLGGQLRGPEPAANVAVGGGAEGGFEVGLGGLGKVYYHPVAVGAVAALGGGCHLVPVFGASLQADVEDGQR